MAGQDAETVASAHAVQPCPVDLTASIVCQKWTVLIIRDLREGPRYFRDLEDSVTGISPRMLCNRLDALREHNIIERREIRGLPPRVEYRLTERGADLIAVVDAMDRFGRTWLTHDF